jgi:hypothetical protein
MIYSTKNKLFAGTVACGIALCTLFFSSAVQAAMSSNNFKIDNDSITSGGGASSSSSYGLDGATGQTADGASQSSNYKLQAGYEINSGFYISLSSPADVTMSPSISGITGGSSTGSAAWNVITDNSAGYTFEVHSVTSPALQASGVDSFTDYPTAGVDPDYAWSIDPTISAFGFSPEGADIDSRYKDNGTACGTGGSDTSDQCWDGLSTLDRVVARRTSANQPSGTSTTLKLRAEIGTQRSQIGGNYSATIVVTALPL